MSEKEAKAWQDESTCPLLFCCAWSREANSPRVASLMLLRPPNLSPSNPVLPASWQGVHTITKGRH